MKKDFCTFSLPLYLTVFYYEIIQVFKVLDFDVAIVVVVVSELTVAQLLANPLFICAAGC